MIKRFHGAHISGRIYVLLRHAAIKSAKDGHRTRQIEIQVRVTTARDRLAIGDIGWAGNISHVQLVDGRPIFGDRRGVCRYLLGLRIKGVGVVGNERYEIGLTENTPH